MGAFYEGYVAVRRDGSKAKDDSGWYIYKKRHGSEQMRSGVSPQHGGGGPTTGACEATKDALTGTAGLFALARRRMLPRSRTVCTKCWRGGTHCTDGSRGCSAGGGAETRC